jgi:energy-coupling factor transporter ATP-binding protein EcfA2
LLEVKIGSAEILHELPPSEDNEIIDNGDTKLISKRIYDHYMANLRSQLEAKETKLKNEYEKEQAVRKATLEEINTQIDFGESEKTALQKENLKLNTELERLSSRQERYLKEINIIEKKHAKMEEKMTNNIKRLRSYIENRATILKNFELIDEHEFDSLFLNKEKQATKQEGISFVDYFQEDYSKAVSYIQAYLLKQNILYPRHVIENFFALIRTNDLIILAGESGSGKTNLIQSFAKAINGVSIIIPVKPNWTSSEDLLGYYNPLEKKYLATQFLDALIQATNHPDVPYLICLDEMNLARVEYYFADFLSKLEQRGETPEIYLYSDNEASHVLSELKNVLEIINGAKEKYQKNNIVDFVRLLQDEELNTEIKRAFGFSEKDSLIKYHSELRRMLYGVISTPSSIKFPSNVRIIGAINIDETTHYLSPKILDRSHIMKFKSPLLTDWGKINEEVSSYGFDDVTKPLSFEIEDLGSRDPYPKFDIGNKFCQLFVEMNREHFHPLGTEFGMRTIRQGLNYLNIFTDFNSSYDQAVNNFLLHKVYPKFTFDGNKEVGNVKKSDLLYGMKSTLEEAINFEEIKDQDFSARDELSEIISKAEANDWIVNYWS